jgi:hypothetical protein
MFCDPHPSGMSQKGTMRCSIPSHREPCEAPLRRTALPMAVRQENQRGSRGHHRRSDESLADVLFREITVAKNDSDDSGELKKRQCVADLENVERQQRGELHHAGRESQEYIRAERRSHDPSLRRDPRDKEHEDPHGDR